MQTRQSFKNQKVNKMYIPIKPNKPIINNQELNLNQEILQIPQKQKNIELFDNSFDDAINMNVPEPNFFSPLNFPDNTSLELKTYTSDTVTDMYQATTIPDLYNTINVDIYKQYKNNDYML